MPSQGRVMEKHSCQKAMLFVALLSITVGLSTSLRGQTAATANRPAFNLLQNDQLWASVWPGDFNGDGITDLAASAPAACVFCTPENIQVAIGDGLGHFGAPIPTSTAGVVLGAADFNRDHRVDLMALDVSNQLVILPGNGNGTFGNARVVGSVVGASF